MALCPRCWRWGGRRGGRQTGSPGEQVRDFPTVVNAPKELNRVPRKRESDCEGGLGNSSREDDN